MLPPRTELQLARLLLAHHQQRRLKGLGGGSVLRRGLALAGGLAAGRLAGRGGPPGPLVVTVALTTRCPCDCLHCSEGYRDGTELPAPALLRAVDQVVATGPSVICLTGGEPLLRRELPAVLERIPPAVVVQLYTSGVGLTRDRARELGRRPNLSVCFSLDHQDPDTNDRLRGRRGAFAAATRGLELMAGGQAELHVSSLLTRQRARLEELGPFARSLRARGVSCLQLFPARPTGRLGYGDERLLRAEDELRMFGVTRALNADPRSPVVVAYPVIEHAGCLGCWAGHVRAHVDAHGHVCPCDFVPLSFGRVTEEPFGQIWARMRGTFSRPGSRCLVSAHPEIFAGDRAHRTVALADLPDPGVLISPPPALYRSRGEAVYRRLASAFTLANLAIERWEDLGPEAALAPADQAREAPARGSGERGP